MRCHGPSTASNARKRPIGTNSKSKAAIAGNCWRPKHQSGGNHDGGGGNPRLGVLPGTFNPVTVAHLALAEAALTIVDEVVFVLPRQFPHKTYSGAAFEQRAELLEMALEGEPRFSAAA